MNPFNASVFRIDPLTGKILDVFLAEVDEQGRMLRSSWLRFRRFEGSPKYHQLLQRTGETFRIERDGGRAFYARIGLAMPPACQDDATK